MDVSSETDCDHLNSLFSIDIEWGTGSSAGKGGISKTKAFRCYKCGNIFNQIKEEYDSILLQYSNQPPELDDENKKKYNGSIKSKEAEQKREKEVAEAAKTPQERITELEYSIQLNLPPEKGGKNSQYHNTLFPAYKQHYDTEIKRARDEIAKIKAENGLSGGGIRRKSKNKKRRIIRKKIKSKKKKRKSKKKKRKQSKKK
jgi:hypothetical protein